LEKPGKHRKIPKYANFRKFGVSVRQSADLSEIISFPEFGGVFRWLKAPGNSADLLRLKYRGPEAEDK